MIIKEVKAKQILDSRKQPTLEVTVNKCKASSPSGKSTGKHETPTYNKSLKNSLRQINSLKDLPEINSFSDLSKIESHIEKKFKLKDAKQFGANALYALESAILKALAKSKKKQLWQIINPNAKKFPRPLGNAIGGGLHSSQFKTHPIFQEFLIIPKGKTFKQQYKNMKFTYNKLKTLLKAKKINDEGALQTKLSTEAVLLTISKFKDKIDLGMDIAATSFYKKKKYVYPKAKLTTKEQIQHINQIIKAYNPLYIEDPLHEEDFKGFSKLIKSPTHFITGDDLTATHTDRLKKAIKTKAINGMIIKPNQNGSLIELANIIKLCKKHKIKTVFSHRSGETLDDAIADYAFAFQTDFIKTGIATPYREAKLKRLVKIERNING